MNLSSQIRAYAKEHQAELESLIMALCRIPAPSHKEERRAAFCRDYLLGIGAPNVYIDEALNVVCPINCDGKDDITVFMAHMDTVFPETEPFEPKLLGRELHCPGVGDDTTNLAVLLLVAKFIFEHKLPVSKPILLCCNSCEEGLGNLKGARQLMADYAGRVGRVFSLDGALGGGCNWAVGSMRYEVTAKTAGGHSYGKFGNRNAIEALSGLIADIYTITPPTSGKSKTTYNVGSIRGGTSVNTIAQEASMLFEFRSDDRRCLTQMQGIFEEKLMKHNARGAEISVRLLGERPCMGDVDKTAQSQIEERYLSLGQLYFGKRPKFSSGSTDCNIPFSLGIPALCFGFYDGDGAHTYEEHIDLDSLKIGFPFALEFITSFL